MTEVLDYPDDILDGVKKIKQYTREMSYEEFVTDPKTVHTVLRNVEVIGEAAKNVPEDIRHEYRDVPWSEMAGMRDKLIHGYASVELQIVWTTVQQELPALETQIESVRDELE